MIFREITAQETEERMALMNRCFGFETPDAKFEHILPKLYGKDNKTAKHYGIFKDGRLVTSIGVYPMTMVSPYGTLNTACIGAVSTAPECRKQGLFRATLGMVTAICRQEGYDLLFLGGKRSRYNHFGFECAGRELVLTFEDSEKLQKNAGQYDCRIVKTGEKDVIRECLALYNTQPVRMVRTEADFFDSAASWNGILHAVYQEGKFAGYFSKKEGIITEMVSAPGQEAAVLAASVKSSGSIVFECMEGKTADILKKYAVKTEISCCEMYNIFDFEKTAAFLGGKYDPDCADMPRGSLEKVRFLLGSESNAGKYEIPMFVGNSDRG